MPPLSVPGFMVTCSRIMLSSPIYRRDGLPRYFRFCGSNPSEAKGWTTVLAPTVARPERVTCERSRTPSPISTSGSTVQKGPITTPFPSSAPSRRARSGGSTGCRCSLLLLYRVESPTEPIQPVTYPPLPTPSMATGARPFTPHSCHLLCPIAVASLHRGE